MKERNQFHQTRRERKGNEEQISNLQEQNEKRKKTQTQTGTENWGTQEQKREEKGNDTHRGTSPQGVGKNEKDNTCPHSDPQNPKLPRRTGPGPSCVGVYLLNDSKAQKHLTPSNRKKHRITHRKSPKGVKSMRVFTGFHDVRRHFEHRRFRIITCGGEEARAFGKKNNSTRSPLFSPE